MAVERNKVFWCDLTFGRELKNWLHLHSMADRSDRIGPKTLWPTSSLIELLYKQVSYFDLDTNVELVTQMCDSAQLLTSVDGVDAAAWLARNTYFWVRGWPLRAVAATAVDDEWRPSSGECRHTSFSLISCCWWPTECCGFSSGWWCSWWLCNWLLKRTEPEWWTGNKTRQEGDPLAVERAPIPVHVYVVKVLARCKWPVSAPDWVQELPQHLQPHRCAKLMKPCRFCVNNVINLMAGAELSRSLEARYSPAVHYLTKSINFNSKLIYAKTIWSLKIALRCVPTIGRCIIVTEFE